MKIIFSILCAAVSFHIFTYETNPVSLWFGAILASFATILLVIAIEENRN